MYWLDDFDESMTVTVAPVSTRPPAAVKQRDVLAAYGGYGGDRDAFKGFLGLLEEMTPEGNFLLRGGMADGLADSDVGRHLIRMAAQDKAAFAVLQLAAWTFANIIIRNQGAVCSVHTSAPAVVADSQALRSLKTKDRMPNIARGTNSPHHLQAGRFTSHSCATSSLALT